MQDWLKLPPASFLDKQPRLKVTVYGSYGEFTPRLKEIARSLRFDYGFLDTFVVSDRRDFRGRLPDEKQEQYFKRKS